MRKNVIVVDGSFIGHRSMYALKMSLGHDVILDTREEMELFIQQLVKDVKLIFYSFNANLPISNLFFYVDGRSWRHGEKMHRPYYEDETKLIGYKENRADKKSASKIDWENYHYCLKQAAHEVNKLKGFLGINNNPFEADDLIYLSSQILSIKYNVIIFANDGDYEQAVTNKNIYFFKNSKSKDLPNGSVIVSKKYKLENTTGLAILQNKMSVSSSVLNDISQVEMGNSNKGTIDRKFKDGAIKYAEPFFYGFVKSIIGDKKDNILPIIGKYSETKRLTRVLEKNILAGFETLKNSLDFDENAIDFSKLTNDEIAQFIVNDIRQAVTVKELKSDTITFLKSLIIQLKQNGIAKNVFEHIKLNFKLMMLSELKHNKEIKHQFENQILPLINSTLNDEIDLAVNSEGVEKDADDIIDETSVSNNAINDILNKSLPNKN